MSLKRLKLGSLFDGIGAFPYAASIFGVTPVWASEILPAAVSITRRHFPDMLHVGDITKLNGAELPPVDVIAFGSPCQDLSQAHGGNRKGLAGERSGLFMEAIRIINEMRCATNDEYPRYAIWENVPGCFSSNARRDYQAVLAAFAEADIPMPKSDRWATAGMVRSRRAHIAWCVYDACRGFGLAQRRKRVFVVCDFGKGSPEEILLIPKSLRWYPPQSFIKGESVAAATESGVGSAEHRVYGICSLNSNSMKSSNPASGCYEADTSRTLDQNCGNPGVNQGGMCILSFNGGASPQAGSIACSESVSPTLKSASSGLRTPCVCEPAIARTLTARGDSSPCADRGQNVVAFGVHQNQNGDISTAETAYTLMQNGNATGRNAPLVALPSAAYGFDLQQITSKTNRSSLKEVQPSLCAAGSPHVVHPEIAGTLCASAAGLSRPAGMASETDLTVAYCLQGNMIGREEQNGPAGGGVNENVSYTLNGTDHHAVAVDCRNLREIEEVSGTLQSKTTPGYSLNYQNPIRDGYIVRRLTPTECERLMGFPDGYTASGHDGQPISDSKRYSMLGNSIATPCAAYIMQGIVEQYAKEAADGD